MNALARFQKLSLAAAISGFVALGLGCALAPTRGFTALLAGAIMIVGLGVGGTALMSLNLVAKSGWYVVIKRIWEGFSASLLAGAAILVVATGLGLRWLYEWARPEAAHDHLLHLKAGYLNVPFFFARMAFILGVWLLFSTRLRRISTAQDSATADGAVALARKAVSWGAGFLVLGAITICLGAFDWLMTIEARWFSTIFGFYNIAGILCSTVTATTVAAILLSRAGLLPQLTEHHLHNLGKFMFGFCTFWAYQWFSQFMLIWYSNLPEETQYFELRWQGGWMPIFLLVPLLNWALPFFLLLPAKAKHTPKHLLVVSAILLVGRWLDLWLMAAPGNIPVRPWLGVVELAGFVGPLGLFAFVVSRQFGRVPLLAAKDPYVMESVHHHG
ncbi:MAG: hypothetical protein SF187_19935 [Deltaproteobacteria bacterium]|nr:hypothetical protein [Deltaproteobacteria bacterium]